MRKIITLAAVLAFTVACNTAKTNTDKTNAKMEVTSATLLEGSWKLDFMDEIASQGKDLKTLFPGKTPGLTFDVKQKSVHGNDGCNNINGMYEVKNGNEIKIGDKLASTMMACNGVSDRAFYDALTRTNKFDSNGNQLVFLADDVVVMRFVKQKATLEGTWVLEKIQTKDRSAKTIDMRFPMKKPTLTFENQRVSGNTGCNNLTASYKATESALEISGTAITRMMCEGVEEYVFTSALDQVKKYRFEDGKLILSSDDNLDLMTFGSLVQPR